MIEKKLLPTFDFIISFAAQNLLIWTKESTPERHPDWLVETHLVIVSEFRAIILKSFWSVRVKTTSNQEKYYWKAPNLVPNSGTRRRLSTMETSIFNSSAPRVRAAASRFLLRATYSFNAYQNTMFTGVIFICNYYMRLKRFTLPEENWKCSAAAAAARAAGGLCEGAQVQHHCSVLWLSLGQKYWFYLFFTLNFSRRYFVTQRRGFASVRVVGKNAWGLIWKLVLLFQMLYVRCAKSTLNSMRYANDEPKVGNLVRSSIWSCSQTRYVQRNYVG